MTDAPDVIILGAGAAGLMCAKTAAEQGRRVLLLDRDAEPGRKISISGGGKANFTNRHMAPSRFVGDPDFCRPALEAFPPARMLDFMARHGLAWEERGCGRLFGRARARTLVDALVRDCLRAHCRFLMGEPAERVERVGNGFRVLRNGRALCAPRLVLATGSPAWSGLGSDDGVRWARRMGHRTHPFRPVLVPLRMPPEWPLHGLAGVSLPAILSAGGRAYADDLLFTHDGLSGPAALQASCRWEPGQPITANFLPHMSFSALLDAPECGRQAPRALLARQAPRRLADALLPPDVARRRAAELSRAARTLLHDAVHAHSVVPAGTAGMGRAEAAMGGVCTDEINAWSMESLRVPGLFIVGELLDVAGELGGYNLHWAWASGCLAGRSLGGGD